MPVFFIELSLVGNSKTVCQHIPVVSIDHRCDNFITSDQHMVLIRIEFNKQFQKYDEILVPLVYCGITIRIAVVVLQSTFSSSLKIIS